jgi:hypothetical protein
VSAAFALLLVVVASWAVTFVAAIQFSRTYRRWQNATGRRFRWSDPAKSGRWSRLAGAAPTLDSQ